MKVCNRCHIEKKESCFYKNPKRPDGLRIYCKSCNSELRKEWRLKNNFKNANAAKIWYYKNHEKAREINKKNNLKYCRDEIRIWQKISEQRSILGLSDSYVKKLIIRNGKKTTIPDELIEIKRQIILLKRKIKNYGKEKKIDK